MTWFEELNAEIGGQGYGSATILDRDYNSKPAYTEMLTELQSSASLTSSATG